MLAANNTDGQPPYSEPSGWCSHSGWPSTRVFYAALGGVVVARREDRRGDGSTFTEAAYGWSSLASLAEVGP